MGVVLVAKHPRHGTVSALLESELIAGSAPESGLVLESPLVDASHARFLYRDGWPSGADIEGRYAAKHVGEKDRVRTLCIRRPRE